MIENPTLKTLPVLKDEKSDGIWNFFKYIFWTIKLNFQILPSIVILRTLYNFYGGAEPLLHGYIWGMFLDALITRNVEMINRSLIFYLILLATSFVLGVINDRLDAHGKSVSSYRYRIFFSKIFASLGIQKLEDTEISNRIYRINESFSDLWSLTQKLSNLLSYSIVVLISLSIVLKINWQFSALIFLIVLIRAKIHGNELKEDWKFTTSNTENWRIVNGYINSILSLNSFKEILLTNTYGYFLKKYEKFSKWYFSYVAKLRIRKGLFDAAFELIFVIILGILATFFVKDYINGNLTIGNISFYIISFRTYISSLKSFLAFITVVGEAKERVKDAYEITHISISNNDNLKALSEDNSLDIELKDVNFTYPNGTFEVIKNLNLKIKKGEKIAIVGENGAGKSTLISLILGLYQVNAGTIEIGNQNLNEIKLETWHAKIGMLLQSFNNYDYMSLKKNIILDKKKPNRLAEINKLIGIDEIYAKYPFKLDQILSPKFTNGISPSGGQWQKIAIARTLYRNTPLIILDEPTSALDPVSEAKIFDNLFEEFKSKTVIIISHRFSTVKKADRIIVLKDGELVEDGSHRELIAKNGVYAHSYNLQADSYKD